MTVTRCISRPSAWRGYIHEDTVGACDLGSCDLPVRPLPSTSTLAGAPAHNRRSVALIQREHHAAGPQKGRATTADVVTDARRFATSIGQPLNGVTDEELLAGLRRLANSVARAGRR